MRKLVGNVGGKFYRRWADWVDIFTSPLTINVS